MIEIKPLATRYDTDSAAPLTVSTPSCCCCCCCCLGTIGGVLTFSGREVSNQQHNNGGHWIALVLGLAAFPLGVGAMISFPGIEIAGISGWPVFILGVMTTIGCYFLAHIVAGVQNPVRSILTPFVLTLIFAVAVVGEALAVLATVGIAWVVIIPLAIWGSYQMANVVAPRNKEPDPALMSHLGLGTGGALGGPMAPQPPSGMTQQPTGAGAQPQVPDNGVPQAPPGVPEVPPAVPQAPPAVPQDSSQLPTAPPSIPDDRLPPDFPRHP